ncbi:hypothetical protein BDW59DRAFT_170995 [Aspergillus cavernicola]|uniref:Cation efflux protein cytoplasmic domain-containing protein n=1 Tax=Aspergillus cavernicola TaxID=176166 RepID=A0ABR4ILQ1_9EURO
MRSGLPKSSAVPILALLIFALLSLVPTVARQWGVQSIHLGYLGFPRHSPSRVKNASIDTRSRFPVYGSQCKSSLFGDFYSSCTDRDAHPHHSVMDTPPRSSFEAAAEPEYNHIAYSATKEPSSITRGVSAFKEFVIKRWDDHQTTQPLPPRHDSVHDEISTHPSPTLVNLLGGLAPSSGQELHSTPHNDVDTSTKYTPKDSLLLLVPLFIHETWQQVCHAGGHYLDSWTSQSPQNPETGSLISQSPAHDLATGEQAHLDYLPTEKQTQPEPASTKGLLSNGSETTQPDSPGDSLSAAPLPQNPLVTTAGQSKDTGLGRDPEHRRGSSMAIDSHFRHSASHHPHPFQSHPRDHSLTEGTTTAREDLTAQHHTSAYDEEGQQPPRYTEENDPFQLASKLKTDEEIRALHPQANTSRKRHGHAPTAVSQVVDSAPSSTIPALTKLGTSSSRKQLQGFYHTQNENIERMLKPVEEHRRDARELSVNNQLKYKIAIYGSFAANICLSILQLYGAIASSSLSLFTTMADSVFDPLSNLTLLLCNKTVNRVDPRKFPAGKARIETAGNICFCFLMTAVSFLLIAFSIRDLVAGSNSETGDFHLPSVIAVAVAFCTKFALFLYCFALRNQVSQIRILWEDHRNDLFINGFGILTSVGGSKLRWWIDPMGAIILSVLISCLWLHTAYHEFQLLIGVTADTKMQQLITYISMTHSPLITAIDTVRAYTSGPRLVVEVDIVMDSSDSLRATHDVAEELQFKLESLPDVERAYVHVDYETTHKPEHFLKKEL